MKPVRIFAAGSLRAVLPEVSALFRERSGCDVDLVLGPSGVLRERIEKGEAADLFISADYSHPSRLLKLGLTEKVLPVACNELCLYGKLPNLCALEDILTVMLDPTVKLGTSTPGADPGGDYAFMVFRLIDSFRPGAYDTLAQKSLQLVGGKDSCVVSSSAHPVLALFQEKKIDVFLGYYTSALAVTQHRPDLRIVRLPERITQKAKYGMAAMVGCQPETTAYMKLLTSATGRALLRKHGFQHES